ncbi:unnamed protein product [Cylindrotheca closterium]|uniref:Orc1-like AAA ATPase domain-containing protein n=1 Tax=Cylindrotheca closterium TaxID=2856 RepID=A0AAD2CLY0_9STRA|nr:unnamed protein product [Cylindrotheca closterium]
MCIVDNASRSGESVSQSTTTQTKSIDSKGTSPDNVGRSFRQETSSSSDSHSSTRRNMVDAEMSQLGLYGRQTETETIRNCLDDLVKTGKNKLLYISGVSGSGKTALAATVADVVDSERGIFAIGKFDQKLRDEPYAGIATAGRHICGEILHRKNSTGKMRSGLSFDHIKKTIIENVGSELVTLAMILPEIEDIVGSVSDLFSEDSEHDEDYGANRERLNTAFRTFFRTVAAFFKPLVMVLDDVQWADLPSLNLMEVLITDDASTNFMLVALYRSNEVNDAHAVSKMIRSLDEKQKDCDFDTTKIEVGDLRVGQVDEILVDLLKLPSYRTSELAEIIHRRTGGNAFFVLNFISMLKSQKLVVYSKREQSWVWDESEVELETIATDNVVDLLKQRMKSLPAKMQETLELAACLGASFREDMLSKVARDYFAGQKDCPTADQISKWLTDGILQGLLKMDSVGYRWVHDKVQEAALSITDDADQKKMRYQVGNIMLRRLSRQELDQVLFVVVNLLNAGTGREMSSESAVSLAELNLRAANRAMRLSGFEVASHYTDTAIELLPTGYWKSHYEMAIKLHTIATNVYSVLGNVEKMEAMYDDVMKQPNVPLKDRLPLYSSMVESLSGRDVERAKDLSFDVLKQLGHGIMRDGKKLTMYLKLNLVKSHDRNLDPNIVSRLPMMKDENAIAAMKVLSAMISLTYATNKKELCSVSSKMVALVNKYGLSIEAANAFGIRGAFSSNLKVIEAHAQCAHMIMDQFKDRYAKAATKVFIYCLFSFTRDIPWVQKNLFENYHYSLQVGDIQMSIYSYMMGLYYELVCGRSLVAVVEETRETMAHLKAMNRDSQMDLLSVLFQSMLNMKGEAEDPLVLKGEAMDETALDPASVCSWNDALIIGYKGVLNAYCDNHQANAEEILEKMPFVRDEVGGDGIVMWFDIYVAVSCLHCARSRGKRSGKYRKHGQNISKKVKAWIAQGCPNLLHLDYLLNAEFAVLKGDFKKACKYYKLSIKIGEKMGRINDAGLASERLGEYLLEKKDKGGARKALLQSIEFYKLWASDYKVESVRSMYEEILHPASVIQL